MRADSVTRERSKHQNARYAVALAISASFFVLTACSSQSAGSTRAVVRAGSELHDVALVSARTGKVEAFLPNPNGQGAGAVVADGHGGWYVSGSFTRIDGVARRDLVRLSRDGAIDTDFVPNLPAEADIGPIVLHKGVLYAGDIGIGAFALDAESGKVLWHTPIHESPIDELVFGNGKLFIAGGFNRIGGVARDGLAALNPKTGKVTGWNAHLTGEGYQASVEGLAIARQTLYVSGGFDHVHGVERKLGVASIDVRTGRPTTWAPKYSSAIKRLEEARTIFVSHGQVLVGSAEKGNMVAFDARSAQLLTWPNRLRGNVASFASLGNVVYLGGDPDAHLYRAAGKRVNDLAAVILPQGKFTSWRPDLGRCTNVFSLAAAGGKVLVVGNFYDQPCIG
jgi:outer membrane protein assembly factor BamB